MIHEDVQHGAAVVHNGVHLLQGLLHSVVYHDDIGKAVLFFLGVLVEHIALVGGHDAAVFRPEQGDVLHNALAADAKLLCQLRTADRRSLPLKIGDDRRPARIPV